MKITKLSNGGELCDCGGGNLFYYLNGKLHREDGPAIDLNNGFKFWNLNGKLLSCRTQMQFERLMRLRAFW
jgi:hypothetical protein